MKNYDFEEYIKPYWNIKSVENESVLPLRKKDGSIDVIPLMYRADKIKEIRTSDLETLYREGTDYLLENGGIRIPAGSNIKCVPYDNFIFSEKPQNASCFGYTEGGYIFFAESDGMHNMQLAVSYEHSDGWAGPVPEKKGSLLPKTITGLKNKKPLKILIFGDSISTGVNSSAAINAKPFADPWFTMLRKALINKYNYNEITMVNTAVGGTVSKWGLETVEENAVSQSPDLLILGFGMNDGSGKVPPEEFEKNITGIISAVKEKNPDCEFILISTMLPHKAVSGFYGLQKEYLPILNNMEKEGIAVANITDVHEYLCSVKRYYDMSGNNVNHPNDFLARLYAQVLFNTMEA